MSDTDVSDTHRSSVLGILSVPGSPSAILTLLPRAGTPAKSQFSHEELESPAFCSYEAGSALVKNVPVNA